MKRIHSLSLAVLFVTALTNSHCYEIERFPLLMPHVKPSFSEQYLCTSTKLDSENNYYVVGFEPNATTGTAHHILIYGCLQPGSLEAVWDCVNLNSVCSEGLQLLWAWSKDVPEYFLPNGVAFEIGGGSSIQYLILQVHYGDIDELPYGNTDDSGIFLHYTLLPYEKLAGIFVLAAAGTIPPKSTEHIEAAYTMIENKTIYPIAYRIHTHSLAKVGSEYVIKPDNKWKELVKRDPLTTQMFYPVHDKSPITKGDTLAARCTMQSDRTTWTHIGPTHADEMCNFYLLYYVKNEEPLKAKYYVSRGPPDYYWHKAGLINIPNLEASTL